MRLLLSVVVMCLGAALPASAQMQDFGPGGKIGRVSGAAELGGEARRGYQNFRREVGYFGAFATSPSQGAFFWVRNFFDAGTARAAALKGCEVLSEQDDCELYAVMMPESLPIGQQAASGLSQSARDAMATEYREGQDSGEFYAFAISGANQWGYARGWATEAAARDTALSFCQRSVARDMPELRPEGRAWVKARGMDRCRVIDVFQVP